MELPLRDEGDRLLPAGECLDIRRRLRRITPRHDLTAAVIAAFDPRTRILPFHYSSTRMAPAGPRAIGAALHDSGVVKTRVVLQQWNPNITPSRIRIDGRVPDMLLISSMQIHLAACQRLIEDASGMDAAVRPLIIAGGPRVIYEPWSVFGSDADAPWGVDIAVRGEEYVLLNLIETLLQWRSPGQSLRSALRAARGAGWLAGVPGLTYAATDAPAAEELVDTGVQRLVDNLDELPDPAAGYRLLEAPSRRQDIAAAPLAANKVARYSPLGAMVFTSGCKFSCPYCPIPAYNQRQHRLKSPQRIADEMVNLNREFGLKYFFGTDDNFFNNPKRTVEIIERLAATTIDGQPFHKRIGWGTEATIHDTLAMKDHLPTLRKAGALILWMGVEDITATFVKKGQSVSKIADAFDLLRRNDIMAVPMLMHHQGQPLWSRGSSYGLLNQVRMLRNAGAVDVQVLTMTPAVGSRTYESAYESGQMIASAGGRPVEPYMLDANYIVANPGPDAWKMQLRVLTTLCYIYNPLQLLRAIVRPRSSEFLGDVGIQLAGVWGLLRTIPRMLSWAWRLKRGPIVCHRLTPAPATKVTAAPHPPKFRSEHIRTFLSEKTI
ncbi:MAG: radical SAM protein [Planctomycetaceae bacterium]|nr:radical SAM protein [Planctomycetaceae bacterium]